MKSTARTSLSLLAALMLAGCSGKENVKAEAPPPAQVVNEQDQNVFHVDHPEQFPLTTALAHESSVKVNATGTVNPDILRSVPVISIATGRVVEVRARLGDHVEKGEVLMLVQSADVSGAVSDYRKAIADEQLVHTQLDRSQLLYSKGAIALNDLQVAQDAEDKAKVDVENTREHIRVLGGDPNNPQAILDVRAPVSGIITDQQVTNAAGVAGLGSPNPFTISDLSHVWIICDVHEDDLPSVHVGENADVRLNAYPDRLFTGRISNIGPILDPNIRTAKVRIEMGNSGMMRVGMFVTATFHGQKRTYAAVPATAILHLHDRDWVYLPAANNSFRRVEVTSGDTLAGNLQEIVAGLAPGQQVVTNALELENTVEQ